MKISVICERKYGQEKLKKPSVLKGIKQLGSAKFGGACACKVFVVGDDVYIYHRDYFSEIFVPPERKDIGTPLNYRLQKYFPNSKLKAEKFQYADNWGAIVLRNDAYLKLEGVLSIPKIDGNGTWWHVVTVAFFEMNGLTWYEREDYCEWERFFEDVYRILEKSKKSN